MAAGHCMTLSRPGCGGSATCWPSASRWRSAGLAARWQAALVLLNHPHLPHAKLISLHDTVGVAQLVFASVAGAGALVALVVAYRRQRLAETTARPGQEPLGSNGGARPDPAAQ